MSASGYPGSKGGSGVAEKIVACFPPHDLYVEPFAGKSAVARLKPPAASGSYLYDVAGLAGFWAAYPAMTFLERDGLEMLEVSFWPPSALIYCDPPYPHETRSKKRLYAREWSDVDHRRLLSACRRARCSVAISTYPNDLYSRELASWHTFTFRAMTRGGVRTEQLFCNYDPDTARGSNDFFGVDYRDRWRLKKKARRQAARFQAMAPAEARFVLRHIIDRIAPDLALPGPASPVPALRTASPVPALRAIAAPRATRRPTSPAPAPARGSTA